MNKYQEAKEWIDQLDEHPEWTRCDIEEPTLSQLKELVDKATPKKPAFDKNWDDEETKDIYNEDGSINENVCKCPNCHKRSIYDFEYGVRFNHCYECGQRILWEE